MRNNKNFGISGKGYYIALILCAAAIGISGYLYHQNLNQVEEVSLMGAEDALVAATETTAETTAPAKTTVKPAAKPAEPAPTLPQNAQQSEPRPLTTASPVSGQQIGDYAMDCLAYNATTRDWRVHNGVDIAAPEGTEVCAAADGTVYTVYEDDSLGSTVVIRHTGGYTTRYASLAADPAVKAGDTVTLGQTIGTVGDSALVETTLGSHIHFSVSYQDSPMDPAEFLKLG